MERTGLFEFNNFSFEIDVAHIFELLAFNFQHIYFVTIESLFLFGKFYIINYLNNFKRLVQLVLIFVDFIISHIPRF